VRPLPPLQHHAAHCCNHSNAVEHTRTGRRHVCHCAPYGSPSTSSSSPHGDAPVNHYAFTLEAAPIQVQGMPRRRDQSKTRQDRRHLHGTVRHTSPRSQIVRHTCESSSPWSIKGRRPPSPRGTEDKRRHTARSPSFLLYWHSPQSLLLGFGGHTFSPTRLVAAPLQAPRCKAI
jgi:hypothetical protein